MNVAATERREAAASQNQLSWWSVVLFILFVALAFAVATQLWSTIVPAGIRVGATLVIALAMVLLASADLAGDPLGIRRLLVAIFKGAIDSGPFDRWTVIHASAGLIFGLWYLPLSFVLPVVLLWELFEYLVPGFGEDERIWNRVIDVAVALVGWTLVVLIVWAVTDMPVPALTPTGP